MSEIRPIGGLADNYGDGISLAVEGGDVRLVFNDDGAGYAVVMILDAERRDQFAKLWAEAERQAEAYDAARGTGDGKPEETGTTCSSCRAVIRDSDPLTSAGFAPDACTGECGIDFTAYARED